MTIADQFGGESKKCECVCMHVCPNYFTCTASRE